MLITPANKAQPDFSAPHTDVESFDYIGFSDVLSELEHSYLIDQDGSRQSEPEDTIAVAIDVFADAVETGVTKPNGASSAEIDSEFPVSERDLVEENSRLDLAVLAPEEKATTSTVGVAAEAFSAERKQGSLIPATQQTAVLLHDSLLPPKTAKAETAPSEQISQRAVANGVAVETKPSSPLLSERQKQRPVAHRMAQSAAVVSSKALSKSSGARSHGEYAHTTDFLMAAPTHASSIGQAFGGGVLNGPSGLGAFAFAQELVSTQKGAAVTKVTGADATTQPVRLARPQAQSEQVHSRFEQMHQQRADHKVASPRFSTERARLRIPSDMPRTDQGGELLSPKGEESHVFRYEASASRSLGIRKLPSALPLNSAKAFFVSSLEPVPMGLAGEGGPDTVYVPPEKLLTQLHNPINSSGGSAASQQTARAIAQQLGNAVPNLPLQPVEITLNPEELGRVRMVLTGVESQIAVSIQAERGETADLMRRHLDSLTQEFRELGYQDISFSFGSQSRSQPGIGSQLDNTETESTDQIIIEAGNAKAGSTNGLDLRL